jgi:ComF family protein
MLEQRCVLCDAPSGDQALCGECVRALPVLPAHCPRCAMPSPQGCVCGACLARPPAFDATVAALSYRFPVDRLIAAFKFHARLQLAPCFAAMLAPLLPRDIDALVALPLHRTRLAERGFNQAQEIARHLSSLAAIPLADRGIRRRRATGEQARLPHDARLANVRGAFACELDLAGSSVAVVDDVMTTGATLEELARTLKRAGAARVLNCVVARTLT